MRYGIDNTFKSSTSPKQTQFSRALALLIAVGMSIGNAFGATISVDADITTSTTWTADNTYVLNGVIFVTNGATLTINAGTVVRGQPDSATTGTNNPGTLVIARGCRILANGTFTQPIIFTDMNDDNVPGGAKANSLYNNNPNNNISEQWGGVVVLGRTYIAAGTGDGPSTTAERQAEGLTRADALFGGGDDDDDSGSLTYVSIRYGGFGLAANSEVNGLTMGAVGRGTTLHHVEVANNVDDGFEWFGGTVNSKYLLTWNIGDDAFDTDMGYRGKSQFGLSVKGACKPSAPTESGVGDKAFEMDGGEAPVNSRPYSLSQWRNYTVIGMGPGAGDKGLVIRDNSRPQFYHSIIMDMGDDAVTIEDLATGADSAEGWTTAANGGFPDAASFYVAQTQGTGRFQTEIADSVFFGIGDQIDVRSGNTTDPIGVMTGKSNVTAATSPLREVTHQAAASNTGKTVVSSLDPRPTTVAQGVTIALPGEGFFDVVNYHGAFAPAENWAAGWTLISSMGVLDTTAAVGNQVVVNADITASTTWTATNTYILDGVIFVTNGATLTINAGTVVRGRSDGETAGSNNPGTLVIARGARLMANGTFTQPVIFTDMDDDNVPGGAKANPLYNNNVNSNVSERWGGVVVLGRTYIAYNTAGGPSTTAERQAEGLTRADALFGGGDDDDNSGSLTYVSIRYGGFGLAANEEVNGLTMGAVGRGTTLHHVEVANNVDDGFEWFGGTVNSKYLLTWNIGDDAFDTDMGYRGKSQFGLSVKGTCKPNGPVGGGVADSGFEMDGAEAPVDSRPYSLSQWRNYTLIGMGAGAGDKGLLIRDNSRPQFYHSIIMDMGDDAVTIQDLATGVDSAEGWTTAANGGFPDAASFYVAQSQGTGRFQTEIADSVFFGIGDQIDVRSGSTTVAIGVMTGKSNVTATASPLREVTHQAAASNTGKTVVSSLDPRPTAVAQGVTIALPGEGFFDVVNYRGAFGPTENWAAGWTLISSMGVLDTTAAVGNQVVVNADITASTTWTATNTYILDGVIFVTNGATLTINAGTVVRGRSDGETAGSNNPGTLVIARGSKLFANGTFTQPVIFTDMDDDNVPGGAKANPLYNNNVNSNVSERWGGVVILGRTYIAYNTAGGPSTTAERQAEGLTRADALFGGGDDDDNSGSLTYVSIRYGGFGLAANEEVNGLTMGAVGRGTTLHHVEVANNVDDGFEWFGGTVNSKYLLTWNIGDDAFDTDMGYRGKSQFGLSVKGTCKPNGPVGGGVADSAFEMDGGEAPVDSRPYSLSQWRNYTLIGMGAGAGDKGLVIRDNSRPQFYHSIIMDMGDDAVTIQDLATGVDSAEGWTTAANGGFPDAASFYVAQTQGTGRFQTEIADSVFFGIGDQIDVRSGSTTAAIGVMTGKSNVAAATSPVREVTHQAAASNTGKTVLSSLDPRPTAAAQGVTISLPGEGFFDVVNYRGAFGPAENWAAGWTLISSMGVLNTTAAVGNQVVVNADITASTTWTATNTYILDGVIFVTNGATLTINAGTVVRGRSDGETAGSNNPGTLVIARGSKLFANGTFTQPVIFTDMDDDNVPGGAKANPLYNNNVNSNVSERWGGVVVLGRTYIAYNTAGGPSTTAERQAEGLTRADALFGGGDDDDNSGSLTYVSIRYGGFGLAANEEVNGLTMGAVGRGTTLHHVEVANNVDDGFEWFGGTVNSKYLLTWNIGDDAFDTDMGYRGKSQFGLSVKGTCKPNGPVGGGVADSAFEMDGGEAPVDSRPYSLSQWRNFTLIGMGAGDKGLVIRDNSRPQFYHSIIMDMGDDAVTIQDLASGVDSAEGWTTAANGGFPDAASFYVAQTQGTGRFQTEIADSVFFGIGDQIDVRSGSTTAAIGVMTGKSNVAATTSPLREVTHQAAASNTGKTVVSSLDPRPTAMAQGVTISLAGEGFFDVVNYRGAFGPAENWAAGWTLISSMGVLDTTTAVPVTQTAVLAPAKFNWMSFYAQPTSLAVADVFAGALNQILIIKDDDGKFYIPAGATAFNPDTPFGSLAQIVLSEGYQVFLRQTVVDPVNQAVTGIPVVPGNLTIQVAAAKFNLVPYPFACEASVAAVLSPEMLQKILIIRDDDGKFYIPAGATVFNPDTPFGSLSMFRSSEGYQVFARSAGFTLVYNDIVCP